MIQMAVSDLFRNAGVQQTPQAQAAQTAVEAKVAAAHPALDQTTIRTRLADTARNLNLNQGDLNNLEIQDNLMSATFNPEELKSIGYTPQKISELQGLEAKRNTAQGALNAAPAPTRASIGVLEEALRMKQDPAKQRLGESELFKRAGLSGYDVLAQSMQQRGNEMTQRYNNFVDNLQGVAAAQLDIHTRLADSYKLKNDDYIREVERVQELTDNLTKHERAMELATEESRIWKEQQKYLKELEAEFPDQPTASEKLKALQDGYVYDEESGEPRKLTILDNIGFDANGVYNKPGSSKVADFSTIYAGSRLNAEGPDFAGKPDSPIRSATGGTVVAIKDSCQRGDSNCGGGWGNNVKIRDAEGNVHQYSHINGIVSQFKVGDTISAGTVIGGMGNTGHVLGGSGEELSAAQLAQGRGTHLDYTVFNVDGSKKTIEEALAFAFPSASQMNGGATYSSQDLIDAQTIMNPRSTATIEDFKTERRGGVEAALNFLREKALNRGDTIGVLYASAGGKPADATFRDKFIKTTTVVKQVESLSFRLNQKKIKGKGEDGKEVDLSPLTGWIKKKNPWSLEGQELNALLQQTIPNLARGVFGEVGVLTDNDIELYRKTLPNLTQPEDIRKSVTALTLRTLRNALDDQVGVAADLGWDMSGLADRYQALDSKIMSLENDIGVHYTSKDPAKLDKPLLQFYKSSLVPGEILIYNKETGTYGGVTTDEFDPNLYTKIE